MMELRTFFGHYSDVYLVVNHYMADGSLFLRAQNVKDGSIANLTVCLNEEKIAGNEAYVDTNNFPEARYFIEQYGLGEFTGYYKASGYCVYPRYKFDMPAVRKYAKEVA